MVTFDVVDAGDFVRELLGQSRTFEPYYGERAENEKDPATKVTTAQLPLNTILSIFHQTRIGGAGSETMLEVVDHMTPGVEFWLGLTSPLPKYAQDVCMPALREQLPDIAAVPLPADKELKRFYAEMVARFGETVAVRSIPKQIG